MLRETLAKVNPSSHYSRFTLMRLLNVGPREFEKMLGSGKLPPGTLAPGGHKTWRGRDIKQHCGGAKINEIRLRMRADAANREKLQAESKDSGTRPKRRKAASAKSATGTGS